MPVIGLQGIKEGVGTTSIAMGLAWALKTLGEPVLVIDFSPNNILRLYCNLDFTNPTGWAKAHAYGRPWLESGFRYCTNFHFLPYGYVSNTEQVKLEQKLQLQPNLWKKEISAIQNIHPNWWILLDLPTSNTTLSQQGLKACSHSLVILNADGQSLSLLPHFSQHQPYHFLINKFHCESKLQNDLVLFWQNNLPNRLPLIIHDDEVFMESIVKKVPPGFADEHSLANKEMLALASWHMVNCRDYCDD